MMKNTTLTRKLAALVLALVGGQFALASAVSAQGLLSWRQGPSAPQAPAAAPAPAAPQTQAAAPAPAAPQAQAAAPTSSAPATTLQVEQKLAELKFDVGPVDGTVDDQTKSAVMAFQKVHSRPRTGELTDSDAANIMAAPSPPGPLVPNGEPNRIEVSLARQVLFLYRDGTLNRVLPVATGTDETPTPTGEFRIFREEFGWNTSHLGRLHNAQYFVGGYAIHGSTSVPAEPASHGCIRIPMSASEWFPSQVDMGMQVVILAS